MMADVKKHTRSHPNIVNFREVYEYRGQVIIVMQLWQGGDLLESLLSDATTYSMDRVARVFTQLLQAAKALHEQPSRAFIHRDIKPENIFLESSEPDAAVLLGDLGLMTWAPQCAALSSASTSDSGGIEAGADADDVFGATAASASGTSSSSGAADRCSAAELSTAGVRHTKFEGTLSYAAPETIEAGADGCVVFSPMSDMWAIGVTLYAMLSGRFPFPETSSADKRAAILAGRYYPFPPTSPVPAAAQELVARLLAVRPEARLTASQALRHPWLVEASERGVEMARSRVVFNLETYRPSARRRGETGGSDSSGDACGEGGASSMLLRTMRAVAAEEERGGSGAQTSVLAMLLSTSLGRGGAGGDGGGGVAAAGSAPPRQPAWEGGATLSGEMLELARAQFDAAADEAGRLDVEQFGRVMARLDLRGMPYERVFAAFAGHKSYIEADSFLAGLARLTEPSEARLRVIFDMYDAHHTGTIDSASLVRVLRASSTDDERLEAIKVERLAGILKEMDTDKTGMVTFDQFHGAIRRDPFLAKLMLQPNLYFRRWVEASAADGLASGASDVETAGRSWSRSHILQALRKGDMSDLVGSVLATVNIEDNSEDEACRHRNNWLRAGVLLLALLVLTQLVYSAVVSGLQ